MAETPEVWRIASGSSNSRLAFRADLLAPLVRPESGCPLFNPRPLLIHDLFLFPFSSGMWYIVGWETWGDGEAQPSRSLPQSCLQWMQHHAQCEAALKSTLGEACCSGPCCYHIFQQSTAIPGPERRGFTSGGLRFVSVLCPALPSRVERTCPVSLGWKCPSQHLPGLPTTWFMIKSVIQMPWA